MKKKVFVYDYETIGNCFLAVYINIHDTNDIFIFQVSDFKNDFQNYIEFLEYIIKENITIVSFNGINFDSQVAYFILKNAGEFSFATGGEIARTIFGFVQQLIALKNEKGWAIFKPSELPFKAEIDLAAINNYNNKAKFASLKWLQYNTDWPDIIDMNCKPEDILNTKEILVLTRYCINDCLSTRHLFFLNKELIIVRRNLSKHFQLNLYNHSEPKIAKEILLDLLSKDLLIDKNELRNKKTFRKTIHLDEAILPYTAFKTKPLKDTLIKFKGLKLPGEDLKGSFSHEMTYRGLDVSFALGGIHGAKKGDYMKGKGMIIKSFDVKSYYPNLCIENGWSPAHLPQTIFNARYKWFYTERLTYSKKDPLNYVFKIILNSVFGLSNDKNSFLKDSFLTMQITCNGQLSLMMLLEDLCENIPGARPLMVNTDGGEIIFPEEYEPLYNDICAKWEVLTKLVLEYEKYVRLIIFDVNNYIGIYDKYEITLEKAQELFKQEPKPLIKKHAGKIYHYPTKCKGRFEIDKDPHKNKSFRIKRIALYNYFVHGIDPMVTLKANKNIYDYCAGVRATGDWKFKQMCVSTGVLSDDGLQKTLRYYVSHKGCKIIKEKRIIVEEDFDVTNAKGDVTKFYKKGDVIIKQIKVEASNVLEQVAVSIDPTKAFDDYNINFDFYLRMINREIKSLKPIDFNQQKLDL